MNKRCGDRLTGIAVVAVENAVAEPHGRFGGRSCGVEEQVAETGCVLRESAFTQGSGPGE